jgi:S-DNA-T family DNA segregation ATPase FtsK/SpoIIIE
MFIMSWEFRKTGPGENVAVEAQRDPFAAPKWAPPVWHMPEGLVLLVNAVRGLVALIRFTLRNIVPLAIAAGLGWLYLRYGWLLPVLAALLVAALLGAWVFLDRPSFVRWIARPARSRWRLARVYRRRWVAVMVTAGLVKTHKGREYLPSIKKVRSGPYADRMLVQMLTGQAPAAWENVAENLAHGFGAELCRVRKSDRPGRIWLELVRKDALKNPLAALPTEDDPAAVDLAALPIGRQEDGAPWLLRLLGTHVLIAGATGAGKGSILWSAVRALLASIRCGLVEVYALDPKRMELSFGRGLFAKYACDPEGMVKLLEDAVSVMQDRAEAFGGMTRTFLPSIVHPFLVVLVDELAFLTAYQPERDLRKRAEAAIATLTSQGRSVGVCVVGALQDPRKDVINLRNLFPTRIALRLDESEQVDMVLGDGARDRGALADLISPLPEVGAGVAFVRLETSPDPVRVRAAYVSDSDIAEMEHALHAVELDSERNREAA